jgi:hypothetical protein
MGSNHSSGAGLRYAEPGTNQAFLYAHLQDGSAEIISPLNPKRGCKDNGQEETHFFLFALATSFS